MLLRHWLLVNSLVLLWARSLSRGLRRLGLLSWLWRGRLLCLNRLGVTTLGCGFHLHWLGFWGFRLWCLGLYFWFFSCHRFLHCGHLFLLTDGSSLRLVGFLLRRCIRLDFHRAFSHAVEVYLPQRRVFLVSAQFQATVNAALGVVSVFLLLRLLEKLLCLLLDSSIPLECLNESSILLVVELEVEVVLDLPKHFCSLLQEANCRLASYVQFT